MSKPPFVIILKNIHKSVLTLQIEFINNIQ